MVERNRTVSFVIPGRIGGKGRARAFLRGGKINMMTPTATASDEAIVRHYGAEAMRKDGLPPLVGALRISVTVNRLYPKSWSAKRRANTYWITGRPDCDNQLKLIADALNGIAYQDDCQIASIWMARHFGLPECVGVTLTELGASA